MSQSTSSIVLQISVLISIIDSKSSYLILLEKFLSISAITLGEIFEKLLNQAKVNINKLKIHNVTYKLDNGLNGWDEKTLFDSIIISAASEEIPLKVLKNLKNNGNLIIPKKYCLNGEFTKIKQLIS